MERILRDVRGTGQSPPPPGLMALIDKDQLAHKLEMRAGEVVSHAQQQGFPYRWRTSVDASFGTRRRPLAKA